MRCCADFLATASHARFLAHAISHRNGAGDDVRRRPALAATAHACAGSADRIDELSPPTWFLALALAFVLLFAAACDAAAQNSADAQPAPVATAAALLDRIAADIAGRWGVQASAVRVEWSSPELAATLAHDATFRLIGGGADGVWYVDVDGATGRASRLRLRAGTETMVPVAARDLERNVTLAAEDIARETKVVWGPPTRDEDNVVPGWVTRRRIARGEPLVTPAVALPDAVKPGDDVRIVYVNGPVELVLAGRAAGSGAVGERVAVRAETGRRLEGVIVAPGTVKVESGVIRR